MKHTRQASSPTRAPHTHQAPQVPARRALLAALCLPLTSLGLLGLGACSSPPKQPPTSAIQAPQAPAQEARREIALFAMGLLDTRYAWGGRGPATGFDCSGLVSHVYREAAGMRLRGSAADLGKKVRPIERSQLQPGDLVFFNTLGAHHSHVGVYVGDGRFVHASNERTGVRIDPLSHRYYAQRYEGAGSLLD